MADTASSLKPYITKLLVRHDLSPDEIGAVFDILVSGSVDPAQAAALLTLLHVKGESVDELYGFAKALRSHAIRITPTLSEPAIDMCGTGGDGLNTFNISTAAMFIVAAAGVPVAKHGNVGITSKSGSADLLRALGIAIDQTPELVARSIEELGIGFMFAPLYHPSMKHIAPIRKSLPFRTVFNLLGPLANPAHAGRQVLGVLHRDLIIPIIETLRKLGLERALVFAGEVPGRSTDMDEISPFGVTYCAELRHDTIVQFAIDARSLGISRCTLEDIRGYSAEQNAEIALRIFRNENVGVLKEVIKLNAAAGLYVAGRAGNIKDGFALAEDTLRSGQVMQLLTAWQRFSQNAGERT